jgi:hypothetical protein
MKKKNLEQEEKYAEYIIKLKQEESNQYFKTLQECLRDEKEHKEKRRGTK